MAAQTETLAPQYRREALYLKFLYAILFVAFAFIAPFETIVFKKSLLTETGEPAVKLIGLIFMIAPLIGLLANNLIGIFADKLKLGKVILSLLGFGAMGAALMVAYVTSPALRHLPTSTHFVILFGAALVYKFMTIPLSPLIDSETLHFLNTHSNRGQFGRYRFWGTFGWAIGAPLMGLILTLSQRDDGSYPYIYAFVGGAVIFLLLSVVGKMANEKAEIKPTKIPWEHLRKDRAFMGFLGFAFLGGVINTSTFLYLGYFFEGVMKNPLEIGLVFGLWTLLEFPVMHYSGFLIEKFGNRWLITTGLLLIALKLYLFSLFTLETPFYIKLLVSLVHGPAFSLHYLGMVDYVDRHAHKDMRATYMGLLGIARSVVAGFAGGIIGAMIISRWGGASLMSGGSVAMILLAIFFVTIIRGNGACGKKNLTGIDN